MSFDTDTEAPLLRDGNTSVTSLSASNYGSEIGVHRILRMLDRHQVPATFFMTAVDAMLHPEMVEAIRKSGRNEIGVHGWIHEFPPRLAEGEEERLLDKAIDYLTKASGKRPVGYRAPSWAFSANTLDLILKKSFLYDSSLQALDEPYEVASHGKNTGLIELAIDWTLTETPYLGRDGKMPQPDLLYKLYRDEFDGAYDEHTMFVLTLHPYLSGHRAPMKYLDQFVAYMKAKPGVWFATCAEVAQVFEGHPIQMIGRGVVLAVAMAGLIAAQDVADRRCDGHRRQRWRSAERRRGGDQWIEDYGGGAARPRFGFPRARRSSMPRDVGSCRGSSTRTLQPIALRRRARSLRDAGQVQLAPGRDRAGSRADSVEPRRHDRARQLRHADAAGALCATRSHGARRLACGFSRRAISWVGAGRTPSASASLRSAI